MCVIWNQNTQLKNRLHQLIKLCKLNIQIFILIYHEKVNELKVKKILKLPEILPKDSGISLSKSEVQELIF